MTSALWELAEACGKTLRVDTQCIPVPPLARRVCDVFGIDPLRAIASGALLMTVPAADAPAIREALQRAEIACADMGQVDEGPARVEQTMAEGYELVTRPEVDDITKAYA
jgi:hydrogenase maturation factor